MSENVTTTNMNGLKPIRPLYKTGYFSNLKKKAAVKDLQEQKVLNKELLNCIKQLSMENERLLKRLADATELHNGQFTAVSSYINGQIVPYVRSIAVATGCVVPEEKKEEVSEEVKTETEGGETMDAGLRADQND